MAAESPKVAATQRGSRQYIARSTHRSCALEILVHLHRHQVPVDYVLMTISIPSRVLNLKGSAERLKEEPGIRELRPVWAVRSVIIPQERNIILFPEHEEFRANVVSVESFSFDPRLTRLTAQ